MSPGSTAPVVETGDLDELRDAVGTTGPVAGIGNATRPPLVGDLDPATRLVRGPSGVVAHDPAEMTVRCGAATSIAELEAALAPSGQFVPLDAEPSSDRTVGGVLAIGRSGIRRLRYGAVRDLVLEIRFVSAWGELATAGGPTVKNVSGYDLVRLLVGSHGTLGVLGEVVLRCLPRPASRRWVSGPCDPFALRRAAYRPSSILWDGTTTWVLAEGSDAEVGAEIAALRAVAPDLVEVDGPPPVPTGGRRSVRPSELRELRGEGFVAEVGVGVVHTVDPQPAPRVADPAVAELGRRVKQRLDPDGRLAPGRRVW